MSRKDYDADYFLRGKESGKSLYEDYRWMPTLTVPMVARLVIHLGLTGKEAILDFGCARGYVVRAFRELGFEAYGVDVSAWAIENADESVKSFVFGDVDGLGLPVWNREPVDWIIAKDVLEHVDKPRNAVDWMMERATQGVFAVVPLSETDNRRYVVADYELDLTHIHRLTLATWVGMFLRPGWVVEAGYRIEGVKDNYAKWVLGNGFITARRKG